MYFTTFYKGESGEFSIIHTEQPRQYAPDLAQYDNCVRVKEKPTAEQAEIIFSLVKCGSLCAGISCATTEKL
jgi:DNA gyrase inhibitor GyrI